MPATQITSPHIDAILVALQHQGSSNDCGPYTTATVLNALLDLNLGGDRLAQQMEKPVWRGPRFVIRRVPNWATFPWGIVDVMREFGLRSSWRPFESKNYLQLALSQGTVLMPIIGSVKPLWAHVMALVAWDLHKGWGFANTQFSHHNIYWITDGYFTSHWNVMVHLLVEAKQE
jgi:hypothetical protein